MPALCRTQKQGEQKKAGVKPSGGGAEPALACKASRRVSEPCEKAKEDGCGTPVALNAAHLHTQFSTAAIQKAAAAEGRCFRSVCSGHDVHKMPTSPNPLKMKGLGDDQRAHATPWRKKTAHLAVWQAAVRGGLQVVHTLLTPRRDGASWALGAPRSFSRWPCRASGADRPGTGQFAWLER